MITPEVIHRRFFPDGDIEAARSAIRRLCGRAPNYLYLKPEPLDARRMYYRLTRRGTRVLGISPKHASPLKRLGRVKRYALASFLYSGQPGTRTLFNPKEFPEAFSLQGHRLPRHPFYLDRSTDQLRLGIVLVDHNAHVRRTVHKTLKPLGRFLRLGWLDEYIRSEAFVVTILTSSEFQKTLIRRHLVHSVHGHFGYQLSRLRPDVQDRLLVDLNPQVVPGLDAVIAFDRAD